MKIVNAIAIVLALLSVSASWAQSPVTLTAEPFDLADVRLLDGPFKTAQELDRRYLHDFSSVSGPVSS